MRVFFFYIYVLQYVVVFGDDSSSFLNGKYFPFSETK